MSNNLTNQYAQLTHTTATANINNNSTLVCSNNYYDYSNLIVFANLKSVASSAFWTTLATTMQQGTPLGDLLHHSIIYSGIVYDGVKTISVSLGALTNRTYGPKNGCGPEKQCVLDPYMASRPVIKGSFKALGGNIAERSVSDLAQIKPKERGGIVSYYLKTPIAIGECFAQFAEEISIRTQDGRGFNFSSLQDWLNVTTEGTSRCLPKIFSQTVTFSLMEYSFYGYGFKTSLNTMIATSAVVFTPLMGEKWAKAPLTLVKSYITSTIVITIGRTTVNIADTLEENGYLPTKEEIFESAITVIAPLAIENLASIYFNINTMEKKYLLSVNTAIVLTTKSLLYLPEYSYDLVDYTEILKDAPTALFDTGNTIFVLSILCSVSAHYKLQDYTAITKTLPAIVLFISGKHFIEEVANVVSYEVTTLAKEACVFAQNIKEFMWPSAGEKCLDCSESSEHSSSSAQYNSASENVIIGDTELHEEL